MRCEIELEGRINPNDAPIESLVRLPGLGIGKAGAVVAYRENYNEKNAGDRAFHNCNDLQKVKGVGPVFQNCNDLQKVKGIGPKTIQNISEWLRFD